MKTKLELHHRSVYSDKPSSDELIALAMQEIKGAETIMFEDYATVCIDEPEAENLFYQVEEVFSASEDIHLVIDRWGDSDVNIALVRPDENKALQERVNELESTIARALSDYGKGDAKSLLTTLKAVN